MIRPPHPHPYCCTGRGQCAADEITLSLRRRRATPRCRRRSGRQRVPGTGAFTRGGGNQWDGERRCGRPRLSCENQSERESEKAAVNTAERALMVGAIE